MPLRLAGFPPPPLSGIFPDWTITISSALVKAAPAADNPGELDALDLLAQSATRRWPSWPGMPPNSARTQSGPIPPERSAADKDRARSGFRQSPPYGRRFGTVRRDRCPSDGLRAQTLRPELPESEP